MLLRTVEARIGRRPPICLIRNSATDSSGAGVHGASRREARMAFEVIVLRIDRSESAAMCSVNIKGLRGEARVSPSPFAKSSLPLECPARLQAVSQLARLKRGGF